MTKPLPPLNWLRTFEAAARHRNFTLAGEELGLTQSAVSQQIKSLETWLKTPLFHRGKNRLQLTNQAREILPRVSGSIAQMESVFHEISPQGDTPQLTILISNSLLQYVVAPALPDFQSRFPDTRLRFLSNIWQDEGVNHIYDLDIRYAEATLTNENARLVFDDELIIIGNREGKMTWAEICASPRIETVGSAQVWSDFARFHKLTIPRSTAIQTDHYGMALAFVESGLGLGLVSKLIARNAIREGKAFQKYPKTLASKAGYYITQKTMTNPLGAQFEDWLISLCNQAESA